MTLEDQTLKRVKRVSEYRPVTEKEYLAAIKKSLKEVKTKLNAIEGETYTRSRALEVYRALKQELDKSTQGFLTGFFQDMFSVLMGDTKKMESDLTGYIDGLFKLDEDMIKNIIGFKEIAFYSVNAKGVEVASIISLDKLLKSVHVDTLKRVKSAVISGAVMGINPNKIASQIGKIGGIEARHLRTVIRTAYGEAQQSVNMASLELNKEFYDGYEYCAKLDKRTTILCRTLDGKKYKTFKDIPKNEIPLLHVSCRSTIVGIVGKPSEQAKRREELPDGTYREY